MLYDNPMSGFDIIKEIHLQYNILLSQGTIYPLLHELKEEGILKAVYHKGNLRTRTYTPTEDGLVVIKAKLEQVQTALEDIIKAIEKI